MRAGAVHVWYGICMDSDFSISHVSVDPSKPLLAVPLALHVPGCPCDSEKTQLGTPKGSACSLIDWSSSDCLYSLALDRGPFRHALPATNRSKPACKPFSLYDVSHLYGPLYSQRDARRGSIQHARRGRAVLCRMQRGRSAGHVRVVIHQR